ncbi:hypothetical protein DWB85_00910 [Seongchinamella sediminis]|uniref:Uncharacterized protein n=1 Tax=Seongchinamella sediminis TaxID=2283635 RepID=A0A3L7E422_9GAMM|nr:hypothetical protein [Seongchinamella sediminis]RLQ23745.1 hypothetical protein DWB85_00910 [Seongchinamella sediminis]
MASFVAQRVSSQSIDAFDLKLGNLVVHLLCGVLVFVLAGQVLRRLGGSAAGNNWQWVALLAAALWLLAPLHVSTVLYAVQRMAQFSTLFVLAGLVLYISRRESWARETAGAGQIVATSLWLLLILTLAVFSKENGILLLWLIAVIEVTLFRGMWGGRHSKVIHNLGILALAAPALLCILILLLAPEMLLAGYAGREFSLEERLLTQARLLWQYLYWLLVPNINQMGFQHDDIVLSTGLLAPLTTLFSLLAWAALIVAAWLLRIKAPLLLFAVLFYLVGHSMESSLWPLEMVYEHRNYLPSVGIFIAVAYYLSRALAHAAKYVNPAVPVFAVLATCGTLLFLRVHAWAEPVRMNAINVSNHPESPRSHFFMAEALLNRYSAEREAGIAKPEELTPYLVLARHHLELMYKLNPRDVAALVMLYYMDSYHTTKLPGSQDWYGELLALLTTRRLQASDISALETLLDCIIQEYCPASDAQVEALFSTLASRYPDNSNFTLQRYRYLEARGYLSEQRKALLATAEQMQSGNKRIYQTQINAYQQASDTSDVLEATRKWLLHDPKRRDLTEIRRLFRGPVQGGDMAVQGATPDA